jgi:predicted DNA-binding transcriptional regulator AlpA
LDTPELIALDEAAQRLGISRYTLWRRLKELNVPVHVDPFNRRRRLVDWTEIDAIRRERLPKKEAA